MQAVLARIGLLATSPADSAPTMLRKLTKRLLLKTGLMRKPSRAERWSKQWAKTGYDPVWISDKIPEPVSIAMEDGFFNSGQSLIEMGCGRGDIAAFLAQNGMKVTAGDFAEPAIALANKLFGTIENAPDFQVLDACSDIPSSSPFDAAFDRGCFHTLRTNDQRQGYVETLAANLKPNAAFLMLHKIGEPSDEGSQLDQQQLLVLVDQHFSRLFGEFLHQPIQMAGSDADGIKGLAIRMRRK